jgi:hypothetical protein
MSPRKNSGSCRWIFDSLGFRLICRMAPQAVRLAGAASLFMGIAAGAASAQTKAATVTSLSFSANGSETSSVAAGTVVTLTAKVTAGGPNVSPGQVNFCDATAAYCTDIHIQRRAGIWRNHVLNRHSGYDYQTRSTKSPCFVTLNGSVKFRLSGSSFRLQDPGRLLLPYVLHRRAQDVWLFAPFSLFRGPKHARGICHQPQCRITS